VASNEVIVPVQCEYFAMEAVAAILSSITKIQNDYNPDLKIEGFLLTMYDPRTSLDTEVASKSGSFLRKTPSSPRFHGTFRSRKAPPAGSRSPPGGHRPKEVWPISL
jgi:chromosome partitioning protein